jgi:XTP/dITP diphosphohydrolase
VRQLVLATHNAHKVAELRRILAEAGPAELEIMDMGAFSQVPDVVESGVTFAENARLKATAVARATGLPAVADDSGLCVDVLGGAPGVFSARWSGRHGDDAANVGLLLLQLGDVPDAHRGAWFGCAAVLAAEGRLAGTLARAPRGSNGFGYDPIFVPEGLDVTSAELSPAEKDAISHRGRALRALAPELLAVLPA